MIVRMTRVRVLGPRASLPATIAALQDSAVLHLIDASTSGGLHRHLRDANERRRRRHVERVLEELERVTAGLQTLGVALRPEMKKALPPPAGTVFAEGAAARRVARLASAVATLVARERALVEERDALRVYQPLFDQLEALLGSGAHRRSSIHLLRLHGESAIEGLRAALVRVIGDGHELRIHVLHGGETVVLLIAPVSRAEQLEQLLAESRVERAALPAALGAVPLEQAWPRMRERLADVDRELVRIHDEGARIAHEHGEALAAIRCHFEDVLVALTARGRAAESARAFVVEGWIPTAQRTRLEGALAPLGPAIAIEVLEESQWRREDAPVVLANPRLFAPFEALTSMLPLPRYGSVDPTPFVAVFFPMFFGVIVGDVGYGLVTALIAVVLRLSGKPGSRMRTVAKIAGAVAVYSIAFGVLYGELFGDLGEHLFGMRPLWFDRREAVLAFLALAVALGVAHLVIGLVVAAINRWHRHRREALGRGLTAIALLLVVAALLVVFEWLPSALLTPIVVLLLIAFPLVVLLEGATALLDLVTVVGHVLSYARVMALGTASVMLAVVANRMVGAFGSLALGIAFALLFHVVNFAITLFSPTIHVMRLHFVEMFGTFFEPGGERYQPLRHWSPAATEEEV